MITQSYLAACSEFPNDNPALHLGVIWICRDVTGVAEPERVIDRAIITMERPDEPDPDPIIVEDLEPLGVEAIVEGECDEVPPTIVSCVPIEEPAIEEEPERPAPAISEIVLVVANDVEEKVEEVAIVAAPDEPVAAPLPAFEEIAPSSVLEDPKDTTALPPASDDPFTILVCTLADVAIGAGSPHVASILPGLLFDARLPDVLDADTEAALRAGGMMDGNDIATAFVATTRAWREILRGTSDDFSACGAAMLDEWASDLLARLLNAKAKEPSLRQELRSRGVAASASPLIR